MASYTKEELAQMIAQLEDSGQNAGTCITAAMRKDRNKGAQRIFTKQENEELKEDQVAKKADTLMMNKIRKYEARCNNLQEELDRVKRENNKLYNRIAELTK
tara:strand:- start:333 stop:638 length:306 start_codon:yes stop_codon:yes gene_type:complete